MTVHTDHHHTLSAEEQARNVDNQKFAMWLFLASEVIIFTAMIAPWIIFRIQHAETVHHLHEELGLEGILLVTFNTFLLLTSSWAMVMGLRQIQKDNPQGLISWFAITALLGTTFLVLQYVEYSSLASKGVFIEMARDEWDGLGARFYGPTAFHGAHVFVGVLWCLFVIQRARQGRYNSQNYIGVEMFGLYWHFVDVVWILLFTFIYLV